METSPKTPPIPPLEAVVDDTGFAHSLCRRGSRTEPGCQAPCRQCARPAGDEFDELADDDLEVDGPQDVDLHAPPADSDFDVFDEAEPLPEYGDFWIDTDDIDQV